MTNSIFSIAPYKDKNTWVFDDSRVGLVKEPFVMGIPDMIESVLQNRPALCNGFSVLFSSSGIPGPDLILQKQHAESGGNWYICEETGEQGWLCPALYLYYPIAPAYLFIKFIED
jgi:hypothetical protein